MVQTRQGLAAMVMLWSSIVAAQPVPPLPPPRPSDVNPPAPTPVPQVERPPIEAATPPQAEPGTCLTELKAAGFDIETAEQPSSSNEGCRIEAPVRLKAVPVPSRPGTTVRLTDQPVLSCRFADRLGHWIGDLVAPLVAGIKETELRAVRTGPGFECRNRNRATTGKLSAHAEGLAIDIAGFEFANGSIVFIKPEAGAAPDPALASLRIAACGWFTTILGPGSDEAHHDHLHVDIEQHGSSDRYRICQ
ncbi:hypothetical protein BB934_12205 [Microvirga ossetica]|uniref:Extensin-like C-terminal domain-containing protein n=1 Tax=Microvirga ossetica TaxID=1882682 RepID=A0A1B2EFY5_9HYPH|nr:extensin family protein [Microvirga ossetica]ANY78878.1 hypothetical protein BB934_12205 [Microvirga ossetica]